MLTFLQRKGVRLVRCEGYSDYYPNAKGGNARRALGRGRAVRRPAARRVARQAPAEPRQGLRARGEDERDALGAVLQPVAASVHDRRACVPSHAGRRLRRQELLTNGASLMGQMLKVLIDLAGAPPVWMNTAMDDLVVEDGRVVGVRATRDGAPVLIEARKGVLLAAGGFAHNAEMRRKYSGNQPNEAQWSIANAGDTGEVLETAMRLGAKTDLLDEAWWLPSPVACSRPPHSSPRVNVRERSSSTRPVNGSATSRTPMSKWARRCTPTRRCPAGSSSTRAIAASTRRRRTPSSAGCRRRPSRAARCGRPTRSRSWRARSASIPTGWSARCNASTRTRSRASIPTSGGDSRRTTTAWVTRATSPTPSLGPLDRSPYYATEIYPGDVGTCGGLITNEHAQVLDESDTPIPGLYATGNVTATVMGRTYPGAGASIANTMVFGYVAAHHVAAESGGAA